MPNAFRGTPSISLLALPPTDDNTGYHAHPDLPCTPIAFVSAFADADAVVKGNRAFHDRETGLQGCVEKMRVELQVNRGIQQRQETFQGVVPTEFVSGANIREASPTEVFHFQKFPRKEISVVYEGGQLGSGSPELLADSRSTDNIGMRQVSDQLVDVVGAERHVPFAQ